MGELAWPQRRRAEGEMHSQTAPGKVSQSRLTTDHYVPVLSLCSLVKKDHDVPVLVPMQSRAGRLQCPCVCPYAVW